MSAMTHEQRQACWYAQRDLRGLLRMWCATSDEVKRATIHDAVAAFEHVPLPDDLAADDACSRSVTTGDESAQHAPNDPEREQQGEEP